MGYSKRGLLMVVSGPAGSGKGTTIKCILDGGPEKDKEIAEKFVCSVSATTRAPRPGEVDRVSYYFISRGEFENRIKQDGMLEYTEYCGQYYGTPKSEIDGNLEKGINVILEIEVEGAKQVKKLFPEAVLIMLLPPDFKTLVQRLRDRGTNTEEDISNRLKRSEKELECFGIYDYVVINGNNESERAARDIINIYEAEKMKTSRNMSVKENFFK